MSTSNSTTSTNAEQATDKGPRKFVTILKTKEEYSNVRDLITDATKAALEALTPKELFEKRQAVRALLTEITPKTDMVDGVKTVLVPVLVVQYVKKEQQKGKRWAYRQALTQTVEFIDGLMKARNNRVSALVSAETAQAGAEPVQPEPVGATTEASESPYKAEQETDQLP